MTEESYVPITVPVLKRLGDSAADIYILREEDDDPILFRSKTYPFTERDWQDIEHHDSLRLFVVEGAVDELDQEYHQHLYEIVQKDDVDLDEKCDAVYAISHQWMKEVFDTSNPQYVLETSEQLLPAVLDVIFSDHHASHSFIVKASTDYALYSHSLNVCLFGVSLAHRHLLITRHEALTRFGPGFLWHDLGKLLIPKDLWDKEDEENGRDIGQIREHTFKGAEMVKEFTELSEESESIILHHHEKLDGSGYPFGLRGDDISEGARICAIVDRFDQLSTRRSERERMISFEALKEIRKDVPEKYDEEIFRQFVMMFLSPSEAEAIREV